MAQKIFVHFLSTAELGVIDPFASISCDEAFAVVAADTSPTSAGPWQPVYPILSLADRRNVSSYAGLVSGGFDGLPYAVWAQPADVVTFRVNEIARGVHVATYSAVPPLPRFRVVNAYN